MIADDVEATNPEGEPNPPEENRRRSSRRSKPVIDPNSGDKTNGSTTPKTKKVSTPKGKQTPKKTSKMDAATKAQKAKAAAKRRKVGKEPVAAAAASEDDEEEEEKLELEEAVEDQVEELLETSEIRAMVNTNSTLKNPNHDESVYDFDDFDDMSGRGECLSKSSRNVRNMFVIRSL